jgi:hypothetical protein
MMAPQPIVDQIDEKQSQVGLTLHSEGSGAQDGVGVQLAASGRFAPPQPGVTHTSSAPHVVVPQDVVLFEPALPPVPEPALPPVPEPALPPVPEPAVPPLAAPLEPPLALPALPPEPLVPPLPPLLDPQAGHRPTSAIAEPVRKNASAFIIASKPNSSEPATIGAAAHSYGPSRASPRDSASASAVASSPSAAQAIQHGGEPAAKLDRRANVALRARALRAGDLGRSHALAALAARDDVNARPVPASAI